MKDQTIESRGSHPDEKGIFFTNPNGSKVYIGRHDIGFFEQLQELPAETKIKMMRLTPEQMLAYIAKQKRKHRDELVALLEKTWFYRETGDEAQLDAGDIPGFPKHNQAGLLHLMKGKSPQALDKIELAIDFFTNERRTEVYTKDDAE